MKSITVDLTPKKMKVRSSAEILEEIQSHSPDLRHARQVAVAAEQAAEAATKFIAGELVHLGGELDKPELYLNRAADLGRTLDEAQRAVFWRDLLASREEVISARAALDGLYAELETAKEREQAEQAAQRAAEQLVRDAQQAARADLESQIDHHPLVVEAQRKLEPYRRRGELVTS